MKLNRIFIVFILLFTVGCGQLISSAKKDFANDLAETIKNHNDPETIKQAIPTYLVLISSMIKGDGENVDLLLSGSKLYGSYASIFVDDADRKLVLSQQAYDYAIKAVCIKKPMACSLKSVSYYEYEQILNTFEKEDADLLFTLGGAWAGLIQANSSDWNAIADLPKVKTTITKVIQLDETISNGDAHLYMAVMQSFLPPAMGGKPDEAKTHFERALQISNDTNLMALLLYAEKYARLVFDKELHDRLLIKLLNSTNNDSDNMLINIIAKSKAKILLEGSNDYF